MTLPIRYRNYAERAITSYDWADMMNDTGLVEYHCSIGTKKEDWLDYKGYLLTQKTQVEQTNIGGTKIFYDFEAPRIAKSQIIKGKFYVLGTKKNNTDGSDTPAYIRLVAKKRFPFNLTTSGGNIVSIKEDEMTISQQTNLWTEGFDGLNNVQSYIYRVQLKARRIPGQTTYPSYIRIRFYYEQGKSYVTSDQAVTSTSYTTFYFENYYKERPVFFTAVEVWGSSTEQILIKEIRREEMNYNGGEILLLSSITLPAKGATYNFIGSEDIPATSVGEGDVISLEVYGGGGNGYIYGDPMRVGYTTQGNLRVHIPFKIDI